MAKLTESTDIFGIPLHEDALEEAEYQGRKVTLNKPFRTPDGPKKFSVYTKNEKGNVVKVNFGDPNMEIKRDDPERRKNFRARHNCDNPGPKWKARYWSCQATWHPTKKVSDVVEGLGESLKNQIGKLLRDDDFRAEVEDFDGPSPDRLDAIWNEISGLLPTATGGYFIGYRSIKVPSPDQIDLSNVGVAWSWNKESARSWYGGDGEPHLLIAKIPEPSVDVWTTGRQFLIHQHDEKEIRLKDNSKLLLVEIQDPSGKTVVEFNPPKKASSGSSMNGGRLVEGARGDWENEGYEVVHDSFESGGICRAFDPNGESVDDDGEVGYLKYHDKGTHLEVDRVYVGETHQRKGIANEMYRLAEKETGKKFRKSLNLKPGGKALWSQPNRPFGESKESSMKALGETLDQWGMPGPVLEAEQKVMACPNCGPQSRFKKVIDMSKPLPAAPERLPLAWQCTNCFYEKPIKFRRGPIEVPNDEKLTESSEAGYEVIENYSQTLFHGSVTPVHSFQVSKGSGQFGSGLYLTPEKAIAEFHARGGRQGRSGQRLNSEPGHVYEIKVKGRAVHITDEEAFFRNLVSEWEPAEEAFSNTGSLDSKDVTRTAAEWAKSEGFDILVFDPKESDVLTPFKQVLVLDQKAIKNAQ